MKLFLSHSQIVMHTIAQPCHLQYRGTRPCGIPDFSCCPCLSQKIGILNWHPHRSCEGAEWCANTNGTERTGIQTSLKAGPFCLQQLKPFCQYLIY